MTASQRTFDGKRPAILPARTLAAALVGAAVVALYFWIAGTSDPDAALGAEAPKQAYYNLLVDGFLHGQTSLARPAPPELAQLADPYEPAANAPYRVQEASYFQGRLYLYFGAGPALLLFLPWRLLTGGYLWHGQAVAVFSALGFLLSVGLFLAIVRRFRPARSSGVGLAVAGTLVLGWASVVPVMLRRPELWEVPISCAYALLLASLGALWRALGETAPRRVRWLALASACYGAVLAARPSLLFGAVVLLLPVWRMAGRGSRRDLLRLAAAAVLPLSAAGLALLAYNYLRFHDPFEFGQRYQLVSGRNQTHLHQFAPNATYLWFNLRAYFYQPFCWSGYFPFVVPLAGPAVPPGAFNVEEPFGVLNKTPVIWLALAAPLAWRGLAAPARARLGRFCGGLVLVFLAGVIPICLLSGCCVRYEVDYMPALALLAAIGVLGVERALEAGVIARAASRLVVGGLLGWSVLAAFSASCEYWDLFRNQRPAAYHALARALDRPAWWLEQASGSRPGPWRIRLRLPAFSGPVNETLVTTGGGSRADYLFLHYADPTHLVIGLEHTGYGGPHSAPLAVDYGREHTLVVEMGSFYPPADHPYFPDPQSAATLARTHRLLVRLDGDVVLDRLTPFYDASPQLRFLGKSPYAQNAGRAFTGQILEFERLAPSDAAPLPRTGELTVRMVFPEPVAAGRAEPLVVTGETGKGDILYLRVVDAGHAVFGLDHWGVGVTEGLPQAVDFSRPHTLRIQLGSLPSAPPADPARRRRLAVWLDDREVLAGEVDFYPAAAGRIYLGLNPIGASSAVSHFSGTLTELPAAK